MISFYDIDPAYVTWLKQMDNQVPNITYHGNNKFLCGVVLNVNGVEYYAPISSNKKVYRTSLAIIDESSSTNKILSTIRFCFMIPAQQSVLTIKNFTQIKQISPNYAALLTKERNYCTKHENIINQKAQQVYKIGTNPNHRFYYTCCNFKKLESVYKNYATT